MRTLLAIILALAAWVVSSSVFFVLLMLGEGLFLEFVLKTETMGLWSLIEDSILTLIAIGAGFFVARPTYRRVTRRPKSVAETAKTFT